MSQFLYGFFGIIITLIATPFLISQFGVIPQIKPLVVQSGSMEPSIKTGSVVFIQKAPDYKPGDVIAFSLNGSKNLITHRLVSNDNAIFQTKGDANEEADTWVLKGDQITGKVVLYIPYLGFGVDVARHPQGFILLVIIPATIIIYEELKTIKKELARFFSKIRPPKYATGAPKFMVIFPVLGLALLLITATGAYFLDEEKAIANVLGVANSFSDQLVSPQLEASQSATPSAELSP